MQITVNINGRNYTEDVAPDLVLLDFLRAHGCYSVKRGCETSNCGLCTVHLDGKPVLSCSVLAVRADGWKACKKRRRNSAAFWPMKAASSAAFAAPASL